MTDNWERQFDRRFEELKDLFMELAAQRGISIAPRTGPIQSSKGNSGGEPDRTILVKIHSMEYRISCEVLELVFSRYGTLEDAEILSAETGFHSRIRFTDRESAIDAFKALNGRNIYDDCCQMELFLDVLNNKKLSEIEAPMAYTSSGLNQVEPPIEDATRFILGSQIDNQVNERTLFVKIHREEYPISCRELDMVFSRCGILEKLEKFSIENEFHSMVCFQSKESALEAFNSFNGRNIYDEGCEMELILGSTLAKERRVSSEAYSSDEVSLERGFQQTVTQIYSIQQVKALLQQQLQDAHSNFEGHQAPIEFLNKSSVESFKMSEILGKESLNSSQELDVHKVSDEFHAQLDGPQVQVVFQQANTEQLTDLEMDSDAHKVFDELSHLYSNFGVPSNLGVNSATIQRSFEQPKENPKIEDWDRNIMGKPPEESKEWLILKNAKIVDAGLKTAMVIEELRMAVCDRFGARQNSEVVKEPVAYTKNLDSNLEIQEPDAVEERSTSDSLIVGGDPSVKLEAKVNPESDFSQLGTGIANSGNQPFQIHCRIMNKSFMTGINFDRGNPNCLNKIEILRSRSRLFEKHQMVDFDSTGINFLIIPFAHQVFDGMPTRGLHANGHTAQMEIACLLRGNPDLIFDPGGTYKDFVDFLRMCGVSFMDITSSFILYPGGVLDAGILFAGSPFEVASVDCCWVFVGILIFDPGGNLRKLVFELPKGIDKRVCVQWVVQVSDMLADYTSTNLSLDPNWMIEGVALAYGGRDKLALLKERVDTFAILVFDPGKGCVSIDKMLQWENLLLLC